LTAQHSPGGARDTWAEPRAVTWPGRDLEQRKTAPDTRRVGLPASGGSGPALGLFSAPMT